ncbi:SoxR reducing system RseC family protein [Echinimonas agarilytica]|uniref:SoxR reducing system RseC family protein n=1 Tax=Echinimonas agarilytica TaxID=1215918 RepID=A0AA42B6L3_9GAMM|nr:SoxR reducing system RseC family protein [Echinimonas agarilytica]
MIETIATVVESRSGMVVVEAARKSSCDSCSDKQCGNGQVNRALETRYHKLSLPYDDQLQVGTQVVVAIPEQGLLTAAGLMFVLPMLSMLLLAFGAQWLFVERLGLHEITVIAWAAGGAWLGYKIARIWHQNLNQKEWLEPRIKRVIPEVVTTEIKSTF